MEEWDDKFFVSLVKKRRYDDMEGVEDSSTCVTALASIAKNEKKKKKNPKRTWKEGYYWIIVELVLLTCFCLSILMSQ